MIQLWGKSKEPGFDGKPGFFAVNLHALLVLPCGNFSEFGTRYFRNAVLAFGNPQSSPER